MVNTTRFFGLRIGSITPLLFGIWGCGADSEGSSQDRPWGNDVTVIGADGTETNYQAPKGEGCITGEGASCVTTADRCGVGVPADVVLDEQGEVIDVVCYPTTGTLSPEQIEAQQGNVLQNQNGSVVVLDAAADGADLEGNLALDANQVVVYGYGPEVSVMTGDLTVDGNNAIVRGIRMQGDLDVLKNNATLVYCAIEGDVHIVGNDTHLSGCDIFGSVRIEGNNTVFNGNRVQGTIEVIGTNSSCSDNQRFVDGNSDLSIQPTEIQGSLGCG